MPRARDLSVRGGGILTLWEGAQQIWSKIRPTREKKNTIESKFWNTSTVVMTHRVSSSSRSQSFRVPTYLVALNPGFLRTCPRKTIDKVHQRTHLWRRSATRTAHTTAGVELLRRSPEHNREVRDRVHQFASPMLEILYRAHLTPVP